MKEEIIPQFFNENITSSAVQLNLIRKKYINVLITIGRLCLLLEKIKYKRCTATKLLNGIRNVLTMAPNENLTGAKVLKF